MEAVTDELHLFALEEDPDQFHPSRKPVMPTKY